MSLVRLLVDAGNSRIKFGLFDDTRDAEGLPKCWNSVTVDVNAELPWSQIRLWPTLEEAQQMASFVTGSNPPEIERVKAGWSPDWSMPLKVDFVAETFPLEVQLPEPAKAGIDRLLNAVAANCLRKSNQPVLIVDSGTATTVDALNDQGVFLGGAILPGFELSARALHHYTALLPMIPLNEFTKEPPTAVGTNTRAAMQSGLFWGQVGAVKELLSQSKTLLDFSEPLVLITGGGGALLSPEIPHSRWMPHLALQGLALVIDEPRSEVAKAE